LVEVDLLAFAVGAAVGYLVGSGVAIYVMVRKLLVPVQEIIGQIGNLMKRFQGGGGGGGGRFNVMDLIGGLIGGALKPKGPGP